MNQIKDWCEHTIKIKECVKNVEQAMNLEDYKKALNIAVVMYLSSRKLLETIDAESEMQEMWKR